MLKPLRRIDKRFEVWEDRGKGSHRMLVLAADGGVKHYPFPCHDDGAEIGRHYLRDIFATLICHGIFLTERSQPRLDGLVLLRV